MSGRTLALVSALALLVPSAAVAKGVQDAAVCGAAGCSPAPLNGDTYLVFEGGPTASAPTERAPFYELRYGTMPHDGPRLDEVERVRRLFVPSAGLLRAEDGTWLRADRRASEAMRRALAGIAPFPADKLELPGVPRESDAPSTAAAGDGPPVAALGIALAVLAGGALLAAGSRRRRRPAAG